MKTQHTPAPWHHDDDLTIRDNDGWIIASARNRCEHTSANARLIAAAPELLFALKLVAGISEWKMHELTHAQLMNLVRDCRNEASAAIAKATA